MKRWLLMSFFGLIGTLALAAATLCLTSGCSSMGYYAQSIGGHLSMLRAARPVPEVLGDAQSDAVLKERLALSQRRRGFAVSEPRLPANAITLMATNPRFVEAFLVGANHEMNRELLCRTFPTDRPGTAFHHFWDRIDCSADSGPIHGLS